MSVEGREPLLLPLEDALKGDAAVGCPLHEVAVRVDDGVGEGGANLGRRTVAVAHGGHPTTETPEHRDAEPARGRRGRVSVGA